MGVFNAEPAKADHSKQALADRQRAARFEDMNAKTIQPRQIFIEDLKK